MLSTTASGLYCASRRNNKLRSSTSSLRSPSTSSSTSARCSGLAYTVVTSSWATAAGRNTLPHSTATAARPRWGSRARAAARTSSSNSATRTSRRGAAASNRRATAWPTSPLPPNSITVRSARSMQSPDRFDLPAGERAPAALGQPAQPHRAVRDAMQPLDLQPQRLGHAAHDALPPLGQRQLDLDRLSRRLSRRPRAELLDAHRASIEHDAPREPRAHVPGAGAVHAEPVGARDRVARVHQPMGRPSVRREEQQARGHHVQSPNVRETGHLGEEVEHGAPPFGVGATHDVAQGLVECQPGGARGGAHRPAIHGDALAVGIDAQPDGGGIAVHPHPPRADQVLGLAPRCDARARQGALQAHQTHSGSSAGVGGRRATDSSSSRGSCSRSLSPRISRNGGVVPYSSGRPSPSPRVTTSTRPRSTSLSMTAPESTPRISSTSIRPTGWRYAMIARVSSAAGDNRRGRSANCARSIVSPYSRRVRNCQPSAISTNSTPWSSL